ncbi:MAG: hypothetical protein LW596_04765 [Ilumatobacteraceae bacterium]|nr:hypothetical protein [Ilumatobacteraceae bacterium]
MTERRAKQRKTKRRTSSTPSMWDGLYGTVEVRRVQPYEANKDYVCPGCHRVIPKGTFRKDSVNTPLSKGAGISVR